MFSMNPMTPAPDTRLGLPSNICDQTEMAYVTPLELDLMYRQFARIGVS
jgi:hypothetical protein